MSLLIIPFVKIRARFEEIVLFQKKTWAQKKKRFIAEPCRNQTRKILNRPYSLFVLFWPHRGIKLEPPDLIQGRAEVALEKVDPEKRGVG